jgi:hypothetical protein
MIAERKIQEAIENGLFDDLPGKGKPLHLEDYAGMPEDLRMGYQILKDAGILPEEMQLKKTIGRLQDLIDACEDPELKAALKLEKAEKVTKFNLLMERNRRQSRRRELAG